MVYAGLGLSGPSRHYRKRGCLWFVFVFVKESEKKKEEIYKIYIFCYVVYVVIVGSLSLRDIITRRPGVASGPSRHYRKRGCFQFVHVPKNFRKNVVISSFKV